MIACTLASSATTVSASTCEEIGAPVPGGAHNTVIGYPSVTVSICPTATMRGPSKDASRDRWARGKIRSAGQARSRAVVTPPRTTSRGSTKPMCTWASMNPGITVPPVASMVSHPTGISTSSAGPTTAMSVPTTTTTAFPHRCEVAPDQGGTSGDCKCSILGHQPIVLSLRLISAFIDLKIRSNLEPGDVIWEGKIGDTSLRVGVPHAAMIIAEWDSPHRPPSQGGRLLRGEDRPRRPVPALAGRGGNRRDHDPGGRRRGPGRWRNDPLPNPTHPLNDEGRIRRHACIVARVALPGGASLSRPVFPEVRHRVPGRARAGGGWSSLHARDAGAHVRHPGIHLRSGPGGPAT